MTENRPINNLVTTERPITWEDVAGKTFWDDEGACYQAEKCDPDMSNGRGWRYAARNLKALGKGYEGQALYDHHPINAEITLTSWKSNG